MDRLLFVGRPSYYRIVPALQDLLSNVRVDQWVVAYVVMTLPVALSLIARLRLHVQIAAVSVRATVQLLFIALVLVPVFRSTPTVQAAVIVAMMGLGSLIARERGRDLPGAFVVSAAALLAGVLPVIAVALATGALVPMPNVVIPITGMLIGNATGTVGLLYHKTRSDFDAHREMIEAMMLDGADYDAAMNYPMQETLRNAMVPRIDSLKTLGIVHIPGAMAGMMIAGARPLEAAGYQLLIFFAIVATAALSASVANRAIYRRLLVANYPHLTR